MSIDYREKIVKLIIDKSDLEEKWAKDLEIGIYNWCIKYSDTHKVVKNWENQKFINLYLEKSRSSISNLDKDSYVQNERLLKRLLENEFLPHDIPFMKAQNVFPERWSETLDAYLKKYEHAYENKVVAMTDMYRCSKCTKRQCTYYELQTRSSDESSTIFIRCINCGHKWRMG
jgi:DNA-directed RNA polymerase subunit M/transcription elongation factor TFIIS